VEDRRDLDPAPPARRPARAATAPVTGASASGVLRHRAKNQRLAAVGYTWAFAAPTASPGARAHYDRRRNLYDRLLGYLHRCLATRQPYDEATAFPTTSSNSQAPQLDN
jgi:hypothetical protein